MNKIQQYQVQFIKFTNKFRRLEYLYILIALFFGFIFIAIVPPGWNPDEPQHYWRTQQIAKGEFMPKEFDGPGDIVYTGGKLLPDQTNFIVSYKAFEGITDYSLRLNFPMWKNEGAIKGVTKNEAPVDVAFAGSSRYSPIVYAPQAAGIWIANTVGLPILGGFFLAKIFGLFLQVAAIALAIYLIPRGKWLIFIIGLLPSTVTQSVAIGGDVMTTSVGILFIALVFKLCLATKKITNWHIAWVATLIMLLGLVKPSYLPLAALVVLIPIFHTEFRKITSLLRYGAIFAFAALPGLIWMRMTSFIQDNYNHGVDPVAQAAYVIHQPLQFILAFLNTYLTDSQPKIYKTLLGNFVWDTAPLPFIFMLIVVVIIVLSLFVSSPREKISKITPWVKVVLLSISALLILVISYGLYVYYTPLKDVSIMGIQSRYFIPFLPLILLCLHNPLPQLKQKWVKYTIIGLLFAVLISTTVVLINRIYT